MGPHFFIRPFFPPEFSAYEQTAPFSVFTGCLYKGQCFHQSAQLDNLGTSETSFQDEFSGFVWVIFQ